MKIKSFFFLFNILIPFYFSIFIINNNVITKKKNNPRKNNVSWFSFKIPNINILLKIIIFYIIDLSNKMVIFFFYIKIFRLRRRVFQIIVLCQTRTIYL